jgi:hypothetical protein
MLLLLTVYLRLVEPQPIPVDTVLCTTDTECELFCDTEDCDGGPY